MYAPHLFSRTRSTKPSRRYCELAGCAFGDWFMVASLPAGLTLPAAEPAEAFARFAASLLSVPFGAAELLITPLLAASIAAGLPLAFSARLQPVVAIAMVATQTTVAV